MRIRNGVLAALIVTGTIAGTTAMSHDHRNDASNHQVFKQNLVGLPADQKIAIDGVPAAGAPWVDAKTSSVSINARGELKLEVKGLLITGTGGPADGTVGPVTQVVATLLCANGSSATTSPAAFSTEGNARIVDHITIPANCLAPVVLVRIFGVAPANPWIAATGLSGAI
ncbi:MAG: hypothetical protein ACRDV3_10355 [Acidothermaceae bacterium]